MPRSRWDRTVENYTAGTYPEGQDGSAEGTFDKCLIKLNLIYSFLRSSDSKRFTKVHAFFDSILPVTIILYPIIGLLGAAMWGLARTTVSSSPSHTPYPQFNEI
jgi:hypothetical protein